MKKIVKFKNYRFAYSMKLNKDSDNTSGDSVNLTPENGDSTPTEEKTIVFPITIKDERQLFKLSKRIRHSKKSLAGISDDEDDEQDTKGHINFAHSAYDNGIRNIALNNVGKKFLLRRISESEESEIALKRCKSAPSLAEK